MKFWRRVNCILKDFYQGFIVQFKNIYFWLSMLAILGIILGIVLTATSKYAFEEYERRIGAGPVFFSTFFMLLAFYTVILFSGINGFLTFLSYLSVFIAGARFGYISAVLFGACGGLGIVNFFLIYLPIYVISIFLLITAIALMSPYKGFIECKRMFNKLFQRVLVIFTINTLGLVFFNFIVGAFFKVLVI
ncbi:MAG TPA: hypothetical protein P5161_03390 [Eubacteriales bacterium]|jgi:hypothetical protein|nr:hypothetical protein [Clostridia bacterium]HRR89801.1 hypothetical protein [Eubacteriales bacterium]HRU84122.1 hypothetical protein [Eubacteriales bacterium]